MRVKGGSAPRRSKNRIIKEALTGMAMRKLGLVEPHYLSPLTTSHGQ